MKLRKPNFFETVFLLTLFLLFIATSWVFAQQPGIPYQAYIIDTEAGYVYGEKIKNVPMANKKILLQWASLCVMRECSMLLSQIKTMF